MPLLIDAHEDLAWNALTFGRDYRRSAHETRAQERSQGALAPQVNGDTLLGWPEYQQAGVAVVLATLFAAPRSRQDGPWDRQGYDTPEQARAVYARELAYYHQQAEAHPEVWRLLPDAAAFRAHWAAWQARAPGEALPVGWVLLMEGAEAIVQPTPEEVAWWAARGVRVIGPAWAGTRYCGGTGEPGPLTPAGRDLLRAMAEVGVILDVSHMDEAAALEALDRFPGPIIASHANPQAVVQRPSNRFLSDRLLRGLLERDAVIGIVPYNRFLVPHWRPGDPKDAVTLEHVAAHVDYICQMAGDARHVALGTDFDGGFGAQAVPAEVDTIADLPRLAAVLERRGYTAEDVAAIFGGNWARVLAA